MAGSYRHATTDDGRLYSNEKFVQMIENLGDAYEMAEEMYGMIWWLADGDPNRVDQAQLNWDFGISEKSPGAGDTGNAG
jgi:hypothetical protein